VSSDDVWTGSAALSTSVPAIVDYFLRNIIEFGEDKGAGAGDEDDSDVTNIDGP
jgi:hypothetical protein